MTLFWILGDCEGLIQGNLSKKKRKATSGYRLCCRWMRTRGRRLGLSLPALLAGLASLYEGQLPHKEMQSSSYFPCGWSHNAGFRGGSNFQSSDRMKHDSAVLQAPEDEQR